MDAWWFTWILGRACEKEKETKESGWFQEKVFFFENLILTPFMKVNDILRNSIHHIN